MLRNFVLDNQEGEMTVRFSLGLEDEGSLRALLVEGAVLELQCDAVLDRKRSYWLDTGLAQGSLRNVLRADADNEMFVLEQPGPEQIKSSSLEELLALGWRSLSIHLGSFSLLQRGQAYSVQLQVRLKERDVPAWKRWTMFFSDFTVTPSVRYQMDFDY